MEEKSNNLPIEVKNKALLNDHPNLAKMTDSLKRAGKIAGSVVLSFAGLGITLIPVPPATIAGYGVFTAGVTSLARHISLKTEPTLLFGSRKQIDGIGISQDLLNIGTSTRMAGYDSIEKMAMMGLQTLVGFSRYKQNLKNTPFELDENGQKIYSQNFTTLTHGINLENFKALEELGYIKIDSMTSKFQPKSLSETISRVGKKNDEGSRSYLLFEKIGFGNWDGAKKALHAMFLGDDKEKENNSKEMQKVSFRLTDKEIDFEEIKQFRNPEYRKSLTPEIRKAANKMAIIARLMENRKISIKQDVYGRDYIKYPSRIENAKINQRRAENKKEATQRSITSKIKSKFMEKRKEFDQRNTEGVETKGKIETVTKENQPEIQTEILNQKNQTDGPEL